VGPTWWTEQDALYCKVVDDDVDVQGTVTTTTGTSVLEGSSAFACPACGIRRCSYVQVQTRSADEAMTVFATCLACAHRWTTE